MGMNRKNDIYICSVSAAHNVSAKDKWLAFVSTTAETNNPQAELEGAFKFLGRSIRNLFTFKMFSNPRLTTQLITFSSRNPMTPRRILRPPVKISWRSTSRSPAKISTFPPARELLKIRLMLRKTSKQCQFREPEQFLRALVHFLCTRAINCSLHGLCLSDLIYRLHPLNKNYLYSLDLRLI